MLFPQSMDITQMSNAGTDPDNVLRATICSDIYIATETGARTTSAITWTGTTEENLLKILRELTAQGYTVTLGSSTITVSWQ